MHEAEFEIGAILASVKTQRSCKQCGVNVGKGLQLCPECREGNRNEREKKKLKGVDRLPAVMNFRRDENGSPIEKKCTICAKWLSVSEFNKRSDTASGCQAHCKACESVRCKKIRCANPPPTPPPRLINCKECGESFSAITEKRFCSKECRLKAARGKNRLLFNSIHVATVATCRRCGEDKPIKDFILEGQGADFKIRPTACASCKRKAKRKSKRGPDSSMRRAFGKAMRAVRMKRDNTFTAFLGCSCAQFRKHLESQFRRGITWKNYGTKWQVDHIIPVASFDHSDIDQVRKCWHYSNLRPLCAIENNLKSDKLITCQPELLLQLVDA